ncbi:MAG: nucleotidyl transferase AbiEii/AbiGii toxin family protein [Bdellovibrionales bacterium]|nr:nucleotidyl transferase AbiEii/AbiGii toxin family protein [Bdellovibrionales bacterium]
MTTKAKGESVRQKLTALSKKLGVQYRNIETVFMIERLVARLIADKNLANHLVFKGGFVGLKIYESPRYTIDLDALLIKANIDETLERVKEQAEADLNDGVWFRFESQIDLATQGEYGGIRHSYRAGIGEVLRNLKKAQVIHFDLGIGDPITPGPQKKQTPSLLSGHDEISWSVYPVETICAEKLHALISHGDENSRSKDVHDLAIFLSKVDRPTLKEALKNCFNFRTTELPKSFHEEIKKLNTARLERGWDSAVGSVANATSFKTAFEKMLKLICELEAK